MIEAAEAVDSPENMETEPRHKAFVGDRGDVTEGGVSPSAPVEEEEEGRSGDYSRRSCEISSKELSVKKSSQTNRAESSPTESRCRDGEEIFSKDKDKDGKDRSREKDKVRSSSVSE